MTPDWMFVFAVGAFVSTILVQLMAYGAHNRRQGAFEAKVEMRLDQASRDTLELKSDVRGLTAEVGRLTTAVQVSTSQLHDLERRVGIVERPQSA